MSRIPNGPGVFRAFIIAVALLVLALAASLSPGSAQPAPPPGDVRVNQDTTGNFQTEVGIVANPLDPRHLVASWADFSFPHPNRDLQGPDPGIGVSFDGGRTWESHVLVFPELCYAPDPVLTVTNQGVFYFGFLVIYGDPSSTACDFGGSDFWVVKSTDGGRTTAAPVNVGSFTDKTSIFSDPVSGAVYVIGPGLLRGQVRAPLFSSSVDGGATFSPRMPIAGRGNQGGAQNGTVGPNGEIYVAWVRFAQQRNTLYFDRSLDGGTTWLSRDVAVSRMDPVRFRTPAGYPINPWPIPAVDRSGGPRHGRLYLAWTDLRFGDHDIVLAFSDDRGDTWSAPVRVNDDPAGNGAYQFFPLIAVDETGRVFVSFLDTRDDPEGFLIASYLALSTDGGGSFGPNVRVSDGSFGPGSALWGDYDFTGLAVAGGEAHPIWADGRNDNMDIFTHALNTSDFDGDGILNDGDGNGQYADHPCTGGATMACDDNCPGHPNADQTDADSDGRGDACDI